MCPQYLLERLLYTGEVKNTGSAKFGGGGGGEGGGGVMTQPG